MSNGKVMMISLSVGLIKKILLYKMSYFPESYTCSKIEVEVEFNLSNYATKSDVKNASKFDTSKFVKESNLASWKSEVVELDIG